MKLTAFVVFLVGVHFSINSLVYSAEKVDSECHKVLRSEDGKTYLRKHYCCNNHVRRNGICVECSAGYISQSEGECMPCPLNSYGKRCALTCISCPEERCHHITGCFRNNIDQNQATDAAITSLDSEIASKINGDTKLHNDPFAGSTHSTTVSEHTTPEQVVTHQHIIVYTACIAGLLLVVTFCYAIIHQLRSKSRVMKQNIGIQVHAQQLQLVPLSNNESPINVHVKDNIYDEIDEQNINDEVPSIEHNLREYVEIVSSVSDLEESESSSYSNDITSSGTEETTSYINPYEPMVADLDLHNYTQSDVRFKPSSSLVIHEEDCLLDTHDDQCGNQSTEKLDYQKYTEQSNTATYQTVMEDNVSHDTVPKQSQDTKSVYSIDDENFLFQFNNLPTQQHVNNEQIYITDETETNEISVT